MGFVWMSHWCYIFCTSTVIVYGFLSRSCFRLIQRGLMVLFFIYDHYHHIVLLQAVLKMILQYNREMVLEEFWKYFQNVKNGIEVERDIEFRGERIF